MADTLKEYLIALGFKVDDASYKKFKSSVATTAKEVAGLGTVAVSTATAIAVSVEEVARQYEGLYYASQRTRASVSDLKSYSFAMKQIGLDAGQAQGAIDSFAAGMRTNIGRRAFIEAYGGTGKDAIEQLTNFVAGQKALFGDLGDAGYQIAAMNAAVAKIDEPTFRRMWDNLPKLLKQQEDMKRLRKEAGLDTKEMEEKSLAFANAWDHTTEVLGIGKDRIAADLMQPTQGAIEVLDQLGQAFNRGDVAAKGWLGTITGIAIPLSGSIGTIAAALWALGKAGKGPGAAPFLRMLGGAVGGTAGLALRFGGVPAAIYYGMGFNGATAGKEDDEPLSAEYRAKHGGAASAEHDTAQGAFKSQADKESFIRASAKRAGIDPDIAMAVARSEGFSNFVSAIPGEKSYGAYQLHVTPRGRGHAVGDLFKEDTGLDPSDPANEHESIMYALEWAKRHGWRDFHGAANTGIGNWQGIRDTALAPPGGAVGGAPIINQTNHIQITASNAHEAEESLKRSFDRSNADLVRNFRTGSQ